MASSLRFILAYLLAALLAACASKPPSVVQAPGCPAATPCPVCPRKATRSFFDMTGNPVAVVTLPANALRLPTPADRPAVRALSACAAGLLGENAEEVVRAS